MIFKQVNKLMVILPFLGMMGCSEKGVTSPPQSPNIIFIMADDLGIGDVGVYGQEIIATPNIDQLARDGMKFNNFYAGSTVCAPSRAALLTGQHTGTTEVRGNGEFPISPDKRIIPEMLKKKGYTNAMFGKWGLGLKGSTGSPEIRGWDVFLGHLHHVDAHFQKPDSLDVIRNGSLEKENISEGIYANDLFTDAAVNFIKEQPGEQPFFLYLSFTIPHAELIVPQRFMINHLDEEGKSIHGPEKAWPAGRHYGAQEYPKAAYAALVESVDNYVGVVIKALQDKGLEENTIVIFTSDNGTHVEGGRRPEDVEYFKSSGKYRGIKRDLYNGGIKEPFIVKWPTKVPPGSSSDHIAAFWDIYPTVAELTNSSIEEEKIDGISFLPSLLQKNNQEEHKYLYWEFHEFGGKQAVLRGKWKGIRLGVNENRQAPLELYDLSKDPGEMEDLSEVFPEKVKEITIIMNNARSNNQIFNFFKN